MGERRGCVRIEVVSADSVEQAKSRFCKLYSDCRDINFYQICKSNGIGEMETVHSSE